jgi:hypothetical protein
LAGFLAEHLKTTLKVPFCLSFLYRNCPPLKFKTLGDEASNQLGWGKAIFRRQIPYLGAYGTRYIVSALNEVDSFLTVHNV